MKKITLSAIANYLRTLPEETMLANPNYHGEQSITPAFSVKDVIADLDTELNRGAEEKAAKIAEYASAHDAVIEAIRVAGVPVSVADIFAEAENSLPAGFTKNKVSYGLRNYWKDEVAVESGKVNLYSLREGA